MLTVVCAHAVAWHSVMASIVAQMIAHERGALAPRCGASGFASVAGRTSGFTGGLTPRRSWDLRNSCAWGCELTGGLTPPALEGCAALAQSKDCGSDCC